MESLPRPSTQVVPAAAVRVPLGRATGSLALRFGDGNLDFVKVGVADQRILFRHFLSIDLESLFSRELLVHALGLGT